MINEKEIVYFVKELKQQGVEYDPVEKIHWRGIDKLGDKKDVILNRDMKLMCSTHFKNDYDFLSPPEKRKLRERIFRLLRQTEIKKQIKQLRGNNNG